MKEFIIDHGEKREALIIDRGKLLFMDEKDARAINTRLSRKLFWSFTRVFALFVLTCGIPFIAILLLFFPLNLEAFLIIILLLVFLWPLLPIIIFVIESGEVTKYPVPGVYTKGIQISHETFVPFNEIQSIEQTRERFFFAEVDVVRMHSRYPRAHWLFRSRETVPHWYIHTDLIGENNIDVLNRIVSGTPYREKPPQMVLHGLP